MADLIASFLDKYRNLTPPDEALRKEICEQVLRFAGVEVEIKDLKIVGRVAHMKIKMAAKAAILPYKEKILKELTESFGKHAPIDLR